MASQEMWEECACPLETGIESAVVRADKSSELVRQTGAICLKGLP